MAHTIEAARASRFIDEVVVSADSEEYARIAQDWGALAPFLRPAELSSDTAKTIDSVVHALDFCRKQGDRYDILVLLQATSPFRTAEDIDNALECFYDNGSKGLVSVSSCESPPVLIRSMEGNHLTKLLNANSTVRRQDMEKYYVVNGAIYINLIDEITPDTSLNDNPIGYLIARDHAIDIDEPLDFVIAEAIAASMLG